MNCTTTPCSFGIGKIICAYEFLCDDFENQSQICFSGDFNKVSINLLGECFDYNWHNFGSIADTIDNYLKNQNTYSNNYQHKESYMFVRESRKTNILSQIQALRDGRPWAIEQVDIILDAKKEFEQDYGVDLGWL